MEVTKGSRLFLQKVKSVDFTRYLDYGSKNGEVAQEIRILFADHDISNKTPLPKERCYYIDSIENINQRIDGIIFTAKYSKELNSMLIEEFLNFLPIEGVVYIIISVAYSLDSLDVLPWKYERIVEDKHYRVLKFCKDKELITDLEKYIKEYKLTYFAEGLILNQDPSVFSNMGLDKGTQALLEKVRWKEGPVLDIGCGSGVMGIIAQKKTKSPVTMVDVNLRALKWARVNIEENLVLDVEIIPNYGLREIGRRNYYETILSNPPYHTDYGVAKEFIEEGYKMLKMGGAMWFVVKNPIWYEKKFIQVFGGVRVIEHLGYFIVVSEKRQMLKKEKMIKSTKKHLKRMENARKKRR